MPLNTSQGREDEAPLLDGDDRFLKVVMRGHPALLREGLVPFARNYRFREGVPDPRGGSVKPAWLNQVSGTAVQAWDSVQGRGTYVDAQGRAWRLLAVNGGLRAILPHNAPRPVALPPGETLPARVTFEQFRDAIYLFRGDDQDPLRMTDLAVGFEPVPDPAAPGVSRIPRGRRGLAAADRLWVMTGPDQVWASDLLDGTSYASANQFRFSDGTGSRLVTIAEFGGALIGLKQKSIWKLDPITGDLSTTRARRITRRYGCDAEESVVDLGNDLGWWCQEGFARLSLTIQGEIQVAAGGEWPPMFTDDIQPLVRRVRGEYAAGITAELVDGRLYIAVPLDTAEVLGPEQSDNRRTLSTNTVVPQATYRFAPGGAGDTLLNGATLLSTAGDFTAATGFVDLTNTSFNCSLRRVWKGANNAVLVYDFKALEPGWQGYDEAEGLFPQYFFRDEYNGAERLFFLNGDGWGTLYEEGCEDAIGQPYVDVLVSAAPAAGDTINVNNSEVVTAFASNTNSLSAPRWGNGLGNATIAARNLYQNSGTGYAQWLFLGSFAAEDCLAYALGPPGAEAGVRFISTTGRRPVIVTTGNWATVQIHQWQPIRTELLTRGYSTPARLERKSALKLQVLLETWDPNYSVALKSDGVNRETTFVSNVTRSRTRYQRPFHRQPWLANNSNDDFPTPGREDYSLSVSTPFALGAGLGVQLHQQAEHVITVNGRARAHQIRISNARGRLRLLGVGYEGRRRERGAGIKL